MKTTRPERLLSASSANAKLRKSEVRSYRIVSLSLSPADEAGTGKSNCPQATQGCAAVCVGSPRVGMAQVFREIMAARASRTRYLQEDRPAFLAQLFSELETEQRRANAAGQVLCARLNTFSDIPLESKPYHHEGTDVYRRFPEMIGWDYTKIHSRVTRPDRPPNLHLVGSWSERPEHQIACYDLLRAGHNVAVPYADSAISHRTGWRAYDQTLPRTQRILDTVFSTVDGDISDLRFTDPGPDARGYGNVIGLRLKSGSDATRATALRSGFPIVLPS